MSKLVAVFSVQHNPLLWRALKAPTSPDLVALRAEFAACAQRLAALRPDVLLMVGTDHLRQWFYDNMPAFLIGKAATMPGTFPDEARDFGLPTASLTGDPELAASLLESGLRAGFDLASSDEYRVDHCVMVPLLFLRPALDLPVVPFFSNAIAPPIAPASRFLQVGTFLRRAIQDCPLPRRVAVIASGHTATEVGGPRQFSGSPGPEFDEATTRLLAAGDAPGLVDYCTDETLVAAGNLTHQFLNFVTALGIAGCRPADSLKVLPTPFSSSPFFEWYAEGADS